METVDNMKIMEWIYYPNCKNKTRLKIQEDTVLEKVPLFCSKCKEEALISTKNRKMTLIKEPDESVNP